MTLMNPKPRVHFGKLYKPCKRCGRIFVVKDRRGRPLRCDECKIANRNEKSLSKYYRIKKVLQQREQAFKNFWRLIEA